MGGLGSHLGLLEPNTLVQVLATVFGHIPTALLFGHGFVHLSQKIKLNVLFKVNITPWKFQGKKKDTPHEKKKYILTVHPAVLLEHL